MINKPYLHLSAAILEPELDLPSLQAKPFAELQPLLLIRMRTLFEQTKTNVKQKRLLEQEDTPEKGEELGQKC